MNVDKSSLLLKNKGQRSFWTHMPSLKKQSPPASVQYEKTSIFLRKKKERETSMCIKVIGDKWVRLCGMNWRCPAREACVAAQCRHESTLPLLFFIFLK
jgi:hypothetical protein